MRTHERVHNLLLRTASVLTVGALTCVVTLVAATPASAYTLEGCRVSGATMQWTDGTGGGAYGFVAQNSVNAWDAAAIPISFSKVGSGGHFDIRQFNFGNVTFDGITQLPGCSGGVWSAKLNPRWNSFWTDGYNSAKKQSVMAHEIGHVLGLGHDGLGPCVGVPLMFPTSDVRWDSCSVNLPLGDDVNGANFIY